VPDDAPPVGDPHDDPESTGQEPATPPPSTEDPRITAANREAARYRRQVRERDAELVKLREATKTDTDRALDAARTEGRTAAEAEWSTKYRSALVKAEALQLLAGKVVAPKLVLPHLPLTEIDVGEDGKVDTAALQVAVDAVLAEFPFLADGGGKHVHHADQGAKKPAPTEQDPNALLRYALTGRPPHS